MHLIELSSHLNELGARVRFSWVSRHAAWASSQIAWESCFRGLCQLHLAHISATLHISVAPCSEHETCACQKANSSLHATTTPLAVQGFARDVPSLL